MKNILVPVLLILGIALVTSGLVSTSAFLNDTQISQGSVSAAVLDFKLNGDNTNSLELDLGEIQPGNSGVVAITVNNVGSLPGNLCIKGGNVSPGLEIEQNELCNITIGQGESVLYEIKWLLPFSAHNTGLNGMDFQLSYEFVFDNGYLVAKQVIIKGRIVDPVDTPTSTETATETEMPTLTPTHTATATEEIDTPVPVDTFTSTPTVTDTLEPTPTETPTPIETPMPTETPLPTETETPIPTDTETSVPTEIPTEVVP